MKHSLAFSLVFSFAFLLYGCNLRAAKSVPVLINTASVTEIEVASSTATSTITEMPPLTPTPILLTATSTQRPTSTPTLTPPPTLEFAQVEETLKSWLQGVGDCLAPCFWGILPGKTSLGEAKNIFIQLGLQLEYTVTQGNQDFFATSYDFESGLSITPILTVNDGIVKNLEVSINTELQQPEVPRAWRAYSPETLVSQYGVPSKVEIEMDRGAPAVYYTVTMYFEKANLIVQYASYDLVVGENTFRVCLLNNQMDLVRLWFGKDPDSPPSAGVSLVEATSLALRLQQVFQHAVSDEFHSIVDAYSSASTADCSFAAADS